MVSGLADPAPHCAAIEAAKAAGAKRSLYTSHMGANPGSLFTATRSHAETERDLSKCLRPPARLARAGLDGHSVLQRTASP